MPRTVRDSGLETRAARGRLNARGKPYYRAIEPGLHLGYRKGARSSGKWVVRLYVGGAAYAVETMATADDFGDADGKTILSYKQAQDSARAMMARRTGGDDDQEGDGRPAVASAIADYMAFLEADGRPLDAIKDASYRAQAFILPKLGHVELAVLTTQKLKRWRNDLAKAPARLRTRKGEAQKYRSVCTDDDKRARRASANRTWTVLRAALNLAFEDGKTPSDTAWRKVKPFRNVDTARLRYLTIAEADRLTNAADPDFRRLLQGALMTGARYGQIAQLVTSDFNPDAGTVRLRTRKGDGTEKVFHTHLTNDGVSFFARMVAGRAADESIFVKDDGSGWTKSSQNRPIAEASKRARIEPPVTFHVTRHTWASHCVMNGVPLLVVAKSLGHSDTRMVEKHYGHLAPSYVRDAIRAGAPRFRVSGSNIVAISR